MLRFARQTMFKKPHLSQAFALLLLFSSCVTSYAEDDDDLMGELAIDLLIGVGAAICEQFVTCNIILTIVIAMATIIITIGLCTGDIPLEDLCNRTAVRRAFTSAIGYGGARSVLRR